MSTTDVIEVLVSGNWVHVQPGSFKVIPNPTAPRSTAKWFEFTVGDAPHKVMSGPIGSIDLMISAGERS